MGGRLFGASRAVTKNPATDPTALNRQRFFAKVLAPRRPQPVKSRR